MANPEDFDIESFLADMRPGKSDASVVDSLTGGAPAPKPAPAKHRPKKSQDFDIDAFLAERGPAPEVTKPGATGTRSDLRTTMATSPAEADTMAAQAEAEKQRDSQILPALGFGAARGASLGAVDRLVGLGTMIGENLGATKQTPANPNAYTEGRRQYLESEDAAREAAPISHGLGEFVGGVPTAIAAPESLAGRLAMSGGLGAVSGALNTREDNLSDIAVGAGIGAGLGAGVEGTVGTVARKVIRGAPKRELDATVRDVMESEAGRATATTGRKLARDIDDIRDMLKSNPDVRKAVRGPAKDALPVVDQKLASASAGQAGRYALVDQTVKPLTVTQLLKKIVDAEAGVPDNRLPLVKKGLQALRDALRNDFAPKWGGTATWSGQRLEISTEQLRKWVSSVQATAEAAMGSINGTNAAKVPADIAQIANSILEERLDLAAKKGGKAVADAVSQIRESDRQVSAWLGIRRALEDRNMRELAQSAGLNKRLGQSNAANANAAGAALALSGHPMAGAAVAGKGLIHKAAEATGKAINNRILVPLQEAAERGATWAEFSRIGLEAGIPQAIVRAAYEKMRKREPLSTLAPVQPTAPAQTPQTSLPSGALSLWPRDYATGTRTQ